MATKIVYLPINLETDTEITDEQAKKLVNTMKTMMDDDFYNQDIMFDNATELGISLSDITIFKSKSYNDLTSM